MSVTTHDSKWRLLVGAAPLIGVAFFVWAAAQGEGDVARSSTARAILAAVAALGAAVAWWTAHQLRIAAALPIARASALAQERAWPMTGQRFVGHFQRAMARAPRARGASSSGPASVWSEKESL